jgi:hypothetical protein
MKPMAILNYCTRIPLVLLMHCLKSVLPTFQLFCRTMSTYTDKHFLCLEMLLPTIRCIVVCAYFRMLIDKCFMISSKQTSWLRSSVRGGRAMAQVVSCRPLTAEARASPCGICGGQSGSGTGISPSSYFFPCQYRSIVAVRIHMSSGDEH